jgi:catechol 2,3-dioxygenase-like lactoylglutathione lyase family enzyme
LTRQSIILENISTIRMDARFKPAHDSGVLEKTRMIDHLGFPVSDYPRSKAFYLAALAPLGYSLIMEVPAGVTEGGYPAAGFGADGKPDFWIGAEGGLTGVLHVAIATKDRAAVDAFHRAALAAGGKDNGAPGLRPHYHPNYYAAFVLDPDGHNIEAVCHAAV